MKYRFGTFVLMAAALLGLCAVARAEYDWHWRWPNLLQANFQSDNIVLTNNGARALAYGWNNGQNRVDAVVAFANLRAYALCIFGGVLQELEEPNGGTSCNDKAAVAVSYHANSRQKHVFWPTPGGKVEYADTILETVVPDQNDWGDLEEWDAAADAIDDVAIAAHSSSNTDYVCVCYYDEPEEGDPGLYTRITTNQGYTWGNPVPVMASEDIDNFSLAASESQAELYLALHDESDGDWVKVFKSTDHGASWVTEPVLEVEDAIEPCVALDGNRIVVAWIGTSGENEDKVQCATSGTGGSAWTYPANPFNQDPDFLYSAPSVSIVTPPGESRRVVSISAKLLEDQDWVSSTWGRVRGSTIAWAPWREHWLSCGLREDPQPQVGPVADDESNPCIGTCVDLAGNDTARALCVWTDDGSYAGGDGYSDLYGNFATWKYRYPDLVVLPPIHFDGTGRRIQVAPDGRPFYTARVGANIDCGVAHDDGFLEPALLGSGTLSALALDAGGGAWNCFVNDDTVWVKLGDGSYKTVFAGSSTAVPGQPSIACYPDDIDGSYQAHIVFAVYLDDDSSHIDYARVDANYVLLDTIAASSTLSESLPCVNSDASGNVFVTWQDGDAVKAATLHYSPTEWTPPGSWTTSDVVNSGAYHPMSELEGNTLHVAWAEQASGNYVVYHATCNVSGGTCTNGFSTNASSQEDAHDKTNPVAAGCGVSVWQEMVGGKWTIRGSVRGDTVTMVSTDSGSYHPHAVAESLGTGPSVNTVSVKLLWTEGVIFEVDSSVYDTGVTKYAVKNYAVSNATNASTQFNNGAKLLNKAGTDSLLAVYGDADGSVVYAQSADGDSWQREVMVEDRDWPAIAEDSSGKRWVVVRRVNQLTANQNQEAYYRNGSSWTGPQTLYTSQQYGTLGPAGLAGSSYTTSGIAYAAFLAPVGLLKAVVLTKFNGSAVAACTVATGTNLGDPTLAVEPYKTDSDHVHLSWADNGVVKYCMDTDGRSSSIASKWTSTVTLSNAMVTSNHPCIAADRDQIVVAWAQGATTEIYSRKRSTGSAYNNWQSELNLSNTSTASDYPTIAMGDTVIVAWEEHRTMTDYDVLACINFGDTVNIADNATKSSYPHVVFQKSDTIPYVHTIWTDEPLSGYHEVRCNKLNLKQSGEGQQSAGKITIPMKPMLAACRPNPFRDRTQISYQLPTAGNVSLRIYDVTGRTVRTLASGFQKPGAYSVSWDSKDGRGHLVPHGVYFYRLDTKGFRDVKKAVVTR